MATTTLSPAALSGRRTTIALKLLMAVSGLLFVFYVLAHMYGNLKLLGGAEGFDAYAHHLRTLGEPILPYGGFLWLFRLLLIAALIAHAWSAFTLWSRAQSARSHRYAVKKAAHSTLSSRWMRWGGVALLLFVVFHLIHFTIVKPNFNSKVDVIEGSPYSLTVAAFQLWWVTLIYLAALVALAMHLRHGVWSACQTLGLTNTVKARGLANTAAMAIAAVTTIGFAIPPLAVLFGFVK